VAELWQSHAHFAGLVCAWRMARWHGSCIGDPRLDQSGLTWGVGMPRNRARKPAGAFSRRGRYPPSGLGLGRISGLLAGFWNGPGTFTICSKHI
jgi:hypothetical protein